MAPFKQNLLLNVMSIFAGMVVSIILFAPSSTMASNRSGRLFGTFVPEEPDSKSSGIDTLVIVTGQYYRALFPGQQATLTFMIKNSQPQQARYVLRVDSYKGWAMTDTLPSFITLQSGEETTVSFTIQVPTTARVGEIDKGELAVSAENSDKPGTFTLGDAKSYEIQVISSDDNDGDGVKNAFDNCPFVPNSDQKIPPGEAFEKLCGSRK
mgnify:CR=1 FL=1